MKGVSDADAGEIPQDVRFDLTIETTPPLFGLIPGTRIGPRLKSGRLLLHRPSTFFPLATRPPRFLVWIEMLHVESLVSLETHG